MPSIGNGSDFAQNDDAEKGKSNDNDENSEADSNAKKRKAMKNAKKSPKRLKPALAKDKKRSSVGKKNMPPKKK